MGGGSYLLFFPAHPCMHKLYHELYHRRRGLSHKGSLYAGCVLVLAPGVFVCTWGVCVRFGVYVGRLTTTRGTYCPGGYNVCQKPSGPEYRTHPVASCLHLLFLLEPLGHCVILFRTPAPASHVQKYEQKYSRLLLRHLSCIAFLRTFCSRSHCSGRAIMRCPNVRAPALRVAVSGPGPWP